MIEDRTRALVPLMLALSATTGLVDAASVLGMGKVFTANMTGNIVFLGFGLAGAPDYSVLPALAALAFFVIGAAAGGGIGAWLGMERLRGWIVAAGLVEAGLLAAAAGFASGYDEAALHPVSSRYAMIALTALAMGARNATVRQMKVADLTTTVLTLTIAGLAADSHFAGGGNPNWLRRIAAILSILAGAAVGAWMLMRYGIGAPLLLAAAIALVASLTTASRLK
ncbi:MAG: YoaK family protein [Pseudomonadota bacterium]